MSNSKSLPLILKPYQLPFHKCKTLPPPLLKIVILSFSRHILFCFVVFSTVSISTNYDKNYFGWFKHKFSLSNQLCWFALRWFANESFAEWQLIFIFWATLPPLSTVMLCHVWAIIYCYLWMIPYDKYLIFLIHQIYRVSKICWIC